ncbi:MAG TPA: S-methyl-5-thioribose-1-phosphate isomerase [Bacteroidota bacterium]|nr:S-methyl-5-thioribose-1-phosphate isomerase [Bacteroidota bacterium]
MTTLRWSDGRLSFLDQTRLPAEEITVTTDDYRVVCEAIRALRIRGAPAIGVAAAFALVLAARASGATDAAGCRAAVQAASGAIAATRPTAVNLFAALGRMERAACHAAGGTAAGVVAALEAEAIAVRDEDVASCRAIGANGARLIAPGSSLLTHCNAGALATAGEGTALAVIAEAARRGNVVRVFVDETRPLLQGARLTAWELVALGIETVLITDSTAGTVLARGDVQAVVVGADRIAANGDTANKVGTYPLAVLAARHGVPFYVAAPTSTIDPALASGEGIPIEEREAAEVTDIGGKRIAARGVRVFAPAFDVTPAALLGAIITERGVARAPYGPAIAGLLARGETR